MKEQRSNWRPRVSISKFSKTFLLGILLTVGSFSFAQTNTSNFARMTTDNHVTIRTGLHASYQIPIGHFGFTSQQEAASYFAARDVNYISFVVVDTQTVQMNFDLTNPAVANWTIADWQQALVTRANNSTPRVLPSN